MPQVWAHLSVSVRVQIIYQSAATESVSSKFAMMFEKCLLPSSSESLSHLYILS
jgi:hypothetical protein